MAAHNIGDPEVERGEVTLHYHNGATAKLPALFTLEQINDIIDAQRNAQRTSFLQVHNVIYPWRFIKNVQARRVE